jgi:hypothetical protein
MTASVIQPVQVRMLRPYGQYKAGQIVPVTGGLARTLELQRYAVRVQPEPAIQFAVVDEPASLERAEAPVAKARRRKRA